MNNKPNNKKVAKSRSSDWKKSLVKGKLEAQTNPTKLRLVRSNLSVSQSIAAKNLKLSASTYLAVERGYRPVSQERADMIAKYFRTKASTLFKSDKNGKILAVR